MGVFKLNDLLKLGTGESFGTGTMTCWVRGGWGGGEGGGEGDGQKTIGQRVLC